MQELEPQLAAIGFDVAPLGAGEWSINAVPAIVDSANPEELLRAIVDEASVDVEAADSPIRPLMRRIAIGMARAAAVRCERRLSNSEISHIVAQLATLAVPGFTPSGKPTFTVISESEIAKML
jgi:DNA mismatch repair protein MutL